MNKEIKAGKFVLPLNRTLIMGVLNVTPNSFSDGGKFFSKQKAIVHARQMVLDGADIIDVGGQSTRPFAEQITIQEELNRVIPVIRELSKELTVPISIDSFQPRVIEQALLNGATIINDVTGLRNKKILMLAKKFQVPVIIMHMKGSPKTMQKNPRYRNVVKEVFNFLKKQVSLARKHDVKQAIIDPGIGFGKTVQHNLLLLKHLKEFKKLDCPILIGTSRKSFIGLITGAPVNERLEGTIASNVLAVLNGANIVRVHDVKELKKSMQIVDEVMKA